MNLFYTPTITEPITTLPEDESKHIIRVLRKSLGDNVYFTDGKGFMYFCKIIDSNVKKCRVEIIEKNLGGDKRNFKLHIAIAPTKNITRFEWFLEKCTEIGIEEITPVITEHSERKDLKIVRLNKVLTSAMKQSLKSNHPILNDKTSFKDFISRPFSGVKFIAYIDSEVTLELVNAYERGTNALVLIGPEGGFCSEEVDKAMSNGFIPVKLGNSRLRTETAGVFACTTISLCNT